MKKRTTPRQRELKNRKRVADRNLIKAVTGTRKPKAEKQTRAVTAVVPRSPLLAYDAACKALAQAKTFDQVREIKDLWEHVKVHAKQVRDREVLGLAIEIQKRADRCMGELLIEATDQGLVGKGKRANVPEREHFTLDEIGIDRKQSMRFQQLAKLPVDDFEREVKAERERVAAGGARIINGDRAVMASRQQPDGDLDFSPTPPWGTRALVEVVLPQIMPTNALALDTLCAWEPACGEGHIAEVLREYFAIVNASDIRDYGYHDTSTGLGDFLGAEVVPPIGRDWIITNPPFDDKAEAFALRAIELAKEGVAIFAQLRFLETIGRYERLFQKHPPTLLAFFAERINLCMGRWEPTGTTATAYMWIVWVKGRHPQAPFWIPPGQRQALEREGDRERFTAHPVIRREAFAKHQNKAAA